MAVSGPPPAVSGRTSPCPSYARLGAPPPPRAGALSASTRSSASIQQHGPAAGSSTSSSRSAPPPSGPAAAPASSPPGPLLHSQIRAAAGRGRTAPAHACQVASLLPARCPPARAPHGHLPARRTHARLLSARRWPSLCSTHAHPAPPQLRAEEQLRCLAGALLLP
jgi:hypothetical protein